MALPNGWNPGDECPECGSRVWDNRGNKRNPKAPDFKCSNAECQGGNGRPWAAWADAPKAGATRPAHRAAAPTAAAPARVTLAPERFWSLMTDALIQSKQALTTAGLPVDQAREIAAQYFILIERNVIVPSTGQSAKAATNSDGQDKAKQEWIEEIELCGDTDAVDAVMAKARKILSDKVLQAFVLAECIKAKRNLTSGEGAI